jgi:hypothetical protein
MNPELVESEAIKKLTKAIEQSVCPKKIPEVSPVISYGITKQECDIYWRYECHSTTIP